MLDGATSLTAYCQEAVVDLQGVGAPRLLHDGDLVDVHGEGGQPALTAVRAVTGARFGAGDVVVVAGVLQPD